MSRLVRAALLSLVVAIVATSAIPPAITQLLLAARLEPPPDPLLTPENSRNASEVRSRQLQPERVPVFAYSACRHGAGPADPMMRQR